MKSWRDELAGVEIEKRRWAVLSHLEQSKPTRSLSAEILTMGARAQGVPTTAEQMSDTLLWLKERQFISVENLGVMTVATISPSGREVARGIRTVPGVLPFGVDD